MGRTKVPCGLTRQTLSLTPYDTIIMNDTQQIPIVTIGGGSGQFMLLSGLRDITTLALTSVVSMVNSSSKCNTCCFKKHFVRRSEI
jgi:hypothetical protein